MQGRETIRDQFSRLPLPAAHLIADMRGVGDNRIIEWLQVELTDLANEMRSYDVPCWRHLRNFLSFFQIEPFNADDELSESFGGGQDETESSLLLNAQEVSDGPFELKMQELIREIARIRRNHKRATQDLSNGALRGRSDHDEMVRVIFLADSSCPASLTSAARCVEYLHKYYGKRERAGHLTRLSMTVLCLNKSGEEGLPFSLNCVLGESHTWKYLDTLIFSESDYEEVAPTDDLPQMYSAELLLYVLLMSPPLPVKSLPGRERSNGIAPSDELDEQATGLPVNTFVANLVALEYSARWARRWFNFGMARKCIDALRHPPVNPEQEEITLAGVATDWFHDWHQQVREAIPDSVPPAIAALEGIEHARKASALEQPEFVPGKSNKKKAIGELESYLKRLTATYVTSSDKLALHDALNQGSSQIMQALYQKEHPNTEKQAPDRLDLPQDERASAEKQTFDRLKALQNEAKQVLGHPKFWSNASSFVESALPFLGALGSAIADFQQEHMENPLHPHDLKENMQSRSQDLQNKGQHMINGLKKDFSRWPFLTSYPFARSLIQWISIPAVAFLAFIAVFIIISWLHHFILENVPTLLPLIDSTILGIPLLDLLGVVACSLLIVVEFRILNTSFFRYKANGLAVEIGLLVVLALASVCGFSVNLSLMALTHSPNDATSAFYLIWLSFMPTVTVISLLIFILIILIELVYFGLWFYQIHLKYRRIVHDLHRQHRQDIQDVIDFIADDVALAMAQHADICNRNGGSSPYFNRVYKLSTLLDRLESATRHQEQLAAARLLAQGVTGEGGNALSRAHVSDEELEIEALTDEQRDLRQQITPQHNAVRVLAEYVLRAQGVETPEVFEQELRKKLNEMDGASRTLHMLLIELFALNTRFIVDPAPVKSVNLNKEDYQSVWKHIEEEMPTFEALVQTFNRQISQNALQTHFGEQTVHDQLRAPEADITITIQLLALWGQLFWQREGSAGLKQSLLLHGLFKHLERKMSKEYDPAAIIRRLLKRASPFGHGSQHSQPVDLYLLMAPLPRSAQGVQRLKNVTLPVTIKIPDPERILLLGIKRLTRSPETRTAEV